MAKKRTNGLVPQYGQWVKSSVSKALPGSGLAVQKFQLANPTGQALGAYKISRATGISPGQMRKRSVGQVGEVFSARGGVRGKGAAYGRIVKRNLGFVLGLPVALVKAAGEAL